MRPTQVGMEGIPARGSVDAVLRELRSRRKPDDVSYFDWARRINDELVELVCSLGDDDARALRARLSNPAEDDVVAAWIATRNNSAVVRDELTDARRLQRRREREAATVSTRGR
jgi:hypothetical protein